MRRPPTAERTGLPGRSLACADTAHERKGFDRLSPNGERTATAERTGLPGRRLACAQPAHARKGFDRLSPNGGRSATAERPGLPGRRLAHADIAHARKGFDRLSPNGEGAELKRSRELPAADVRMRPLRLERTHAACANGLPISSSDVSSAPGGRPSFQGRSTG